MSHPVPTRTYEDDILDRWTDEELSRLFELYKQECDQAHVKADLSQFPVWLEEKYF
jgi:hypothetical protein